LPDVEKPGNLIYLTYFNAGLRVYDIKDPIQPVESGWFIPPDPTANSGPLPKDVVAQTEDAGRHPRLHLHHGQELGDVDPALFRPQPAHTDGPLTQSSERVIIMTRRAAQATRGHSFGV
jgi:hypothetical protein